MSKKAGRFQFFYASKVVDDLPYPNVPVRDVTNTWHEGHKTEPHLEKQMENWCPCRVRYVKKSVWDALQLLEQGGQHYMILTTRHPKTKKPFAVGLLQFSQREYDKARKLHPRRWNDGKYLPYVGSKDSKLVSWKGALNLTPWMKKDHLPGARCGCVDIKDDLLKKILEHFRKKTNCHKEFLNNVRFLEKKLKKENPEEWRRYKKKLDGATGCKSAC